MAKRNGGKKGRNGDKKKGRWKIKDAGKTHPISAFVRGKMSGEEYFRVTGQR